MGGVAGIDIRVALESDMLRNDTSGYGSSGIIILIIYSSSTASGWISDLAKSASIAVHLPDAPSRGECTCSSAVGGPIEHALVHRRKCGIQIIGGVADGISGTTCQANESGSLTGSANRV